MLSKGESESFQQKIILQIKNLSKVYYRNAGISSIANADDEYVVLNNLSMDIKDGEFVTIVGPSGCGKSTLLNIIAGIDREYSGGEILFNGLQSDHITSTLLISIRTRSLSFKKQLSFLGLQSSKM